MAGQIRATTFVPELSIDEINKSWWIKVVGDDPETENTDYQKNMKILKGSFNDNPLVVVGQPERIDWILEAATDETPKTLPPILGPMSNSILEPLLKIVKRWFDNCPSVSRLAFAAFLTKQVGSVQTGCEEIQRYLPSVQLDPKETTDFSYKINRPKKSSIEPSITINRLQKWSIETISNLGVTIGSREPMSTRIRDQCICQLILDINTAILDNTISGDNAWEIFQELIMHGKKITRDGDV